MTPQESNEQNPDCGKLNRTNDSSSSMEGCEEKRDRGEDLQMCERPINQPQCENLAWIQIQATIKTDKETLKGDWDNVNADWIFDATKKSLLHFLDVIMALRSRYL